MSNERIALVVGNAAYQHTTPLETPVNDALAMADKLEGLGFKVQFAENCDISDFQNEIDRFLQSISSADAALFYYSGHALQYGGENYLIPVDTRLAAASGLTRLTFQLTPLLEGMRSKAGVSLVFLDACRDNPFEFDPRGPGPAAKGGIAKSSGLTTAIPQKALKQALIAFAAEQGKTAADGEQGNLSPFTRALCEFIEVPGLAVSSMMQQVKKAVREATQGRQIPWSTDSMETDFYFNPGTAGPEPAKKPTRLFVDTGASETKRSRVETDVRGTRLPNLAAAIESLARSIGPIMLAALSMMIAFVLLAISNALDLAVIKDVDTGKQIGFMAAPNWSIVYTLLFPFYLCLFGVLTQRCRITLTGLVRLRVIVDAEGNSVTEERLLSAWKMALQNVSLLLWLMLVIIAIYSIYEWITSCLMPYFNGNGVARDWTTYASILGSKAQKVKSVIFSCVAYSYMAVALYVYLAILVYAATFCNFLNTLADATGDFRMVLRDRALVNRFSYIGIIIYWSVILGLGAGFMMRLQAVYLDSSHTIVTNLLLADVLGWFGPLPTATAISNLDAAIVPSAWTSLVEIIFTLLILFACCFLLDSTFERAKQYYLENIKDPAWRTLMRIEQDKHQIEAIRRQTFLATAIPMYIHFGFILAGVAASAVFIGHGIIPLLTLAYLVLALTVFRGFGGARKDDEEQ